MQLKLFMMMLGGRPPGRHTEQHDIFFGIAGSLKELVQAIKSFWPEAKQNLHVDAWREVISVNGYNVQVLLNEENLRQQDAEEPKLFFLNLGGYKPGEFDEFHYKMLAVASDQAGAIRQARQSAFYKHTGFKGAASHIDDKFGVDVDELYQVKDILPAEMKAKYIIKLSPATDDQGEDALHLGYFKLNKL